MKKLLLLLLFPIFSFAQTRQSGGISFTPQWNYKISGSDTTWQFGNTLINQFPYILTKWQSDQRYAPIAGGGYVPATRLISTGIGLLGGGNLGSNLTLYVDTANITSKTFFNTRIGTAIAASIATKEPSIIAGTTLQYWRGDKTFQTLNTAAVPELTNLYYTNARGIGSTLTGYSSGAGTVSASDNILQAIQKLNGNIGTLTGFTQYNIPFGSSGGSLTQSNNLYYNTNYAQLYRAGNEMVGSGSGQSLVYVNGDSFSTYPAGGANNSWVTLTSAKLNLFPYDNAVSGAQVADQTTYIYNRTTVLGSVNYHQLGVNDVTVYLADTAKQTAFRYALRANLYYLAVPNSRKVLGSAGSYGGTWTAGSTYGIGKTSTVSGSTATFTVTGSTVLIGIQQGFTGRDGTATMTIDGVSTGGTLTGATSVNITTQNGLAYSPKLLKYSGLSNTSHTIVITTTNNSPFYIDWVAGLDGTNLGSIGYVGNVTYRSAAGYITFGGNATMIDGYNTIISGVVSEINGLGGHLISVNTNAAVNPSTDLAGDGLHPNSTGYINISAAYNAAYVANNYNVNFYGTQYGTSDGFSSAGVFTGSDIFQHSYNIDHTRLVGFSINGVSKLTVDATTITPTASITPATTATYNLGSSGVRWNSIFGTASNMTATATAASFTSTNTANQSVIISGNNGKIRNDISDFTNPTVLFQNNSTADTYIYNDANTTGYGARLVLSAGGSFYTGFKYVKAASGAPVFEIQATGGTTTIGGAATIAGTLTPTIDNAYDSGGSSFKWANVYATNYTGSIFNSSATQTTVNGISSGAIVCSQPFQGSSYKKVLIYLNNLTSTSISYTYPVAFTQTPKMDIYYTGTMSPTSDATHITVTGTGANGWITLEGY